MTLKKGAHTQYQFEWSQLRQNSNSTLDYQTRANERKHSSEIFYSFHILSIAEEYFGFVLTLQNMDTESSDTVISPNKTAPAPARVELTTEMKLSKLFENIFQITLDQNYSHPSNRCIFIGEPDDQLDDMLLKPGNLDEVNSHLLLCIHQNS